MTDTIMGFEDLPRQEQNLPTILGLAVGRASVCWENMSGTGTFESDDAKRIVDEVLVWINERYEVKQPVDTEPPFQETGRSPILRYFSWNHLPDKLAIVSKPFATLAWQLEGELPPGPEKSTALRKLLEAKDAAVRAALDN